MATLKEVAHLAGVSVSTVSKYLSGDIQVKDETKTRLDRAIESSGYLNNAKLAKRYGVNKMLAIVVPYISNSKFSYMIDKVIEAAENEGYNVMAFSTRNLFKIENKIVDDIIKLGVSGVILVTEPQGQDSRLNLKRLTDCGIHVVSVNREFKNNVYPSICNNYYGSIKDVILHFYHNDCKHIGFMVGWEGQNGNMDFFKAIEDAKAEIGVTDELTVEYYYTDYNTSKYELGLEILLSKGVKGIFSIDGLMAIEILKGLEKRGIKYPDDIQVISTTDSDNFRIMGITAVDTNPKEIATVSVRTLINQIRGLPFDHFSHIHSRLIVRNSTLKNQM